MEAEWERLEPYVPLDLEGARRLLLPWRVSVESLALLEEGRANTNYRIETGDGPRVLRLHQRQGERFDLSYLAPPELPIPTCRIASPTLSLYDWLPGITLERALAQGRDLPYGKIARQLAHARLAMNRSRCASAGFFDADKPGAALDLSGRHDNPLIVKEVWPSAVEGLLGYLRSLLPETKMDRSLKARTERTVDDAECRLQTIAGPPVLVHGDFKPSNLLVDESGLTAVLDWEFAHAGTWLSDVGQILRHPETLPPGFADAFLKALDAPADAALLARTLDLVNLVHFLHDRRDRPILRRDVERRIAEVCDHYEARFG